MLASSKAKVENLMNLVMQFRKVCNHPDLFEGRFGRAPLTLAKLNLGIVPNLWLPARPEVVIGNQSPIDFALPKLVYDECFLPTDNMTRLYTHIRRDCDPAFSTVSAQTHFALFNIFTEKQISEGSGILNLLMMSNNWGAGDMARMALA